MGRTAWEGKLLCVRGEREWMEICPEMDEKPAESLLVRVTEKTRISDFIMGFKGL